jgi:hypothetical protein
MDPDIGNIALAIPGRGSDADSFRPLSRVDVGSISISDGHSALLTQDGGAILTPDGFILGIIDGSLVLMEHKPATPEIGGAADV